MDKKTIKSIKRVTRARVKGLDLRTRVANTDKKKKDMKKSRRAWKQKGKHDG